jgi:hypothetical protein
MYKIIVTHTRVKQPDWLGFRNREAPLHRFIKEDAEEDRDGARQLVAKFR